VTERLYYTDSYLTDFRAGVAEISSDRRRVYLDRTAFYPSSGGQPHDLGAINGIEITEIVDEDDHVAHVLAAPLEAADVECRVDWARRFDHMQQHTGQHLLSAVLLDLFDAQTVSFHMGADSSTIDIQRASLDAGDVRRAMERANQVVFENRPVTVTFRHSSEDLGLRKVTEREGTVRIISIEGLDRSACGGTHVRATGEIGPTVIRKIEKVRGNVRLEFLCGMRAVRRALADYEALANISRAFSSAVDEAPGLVAAQIEKLQAAEKTVRKLSMELAQARGRQLYADTARDADGYRRVRRDAAAITEDLRAEAQSFTAGEKSMFIATVKEPASLLVAVSKDSGMNAGQIVKDAVAAVGGRGGGSPAMGQGSVASWEVLQTVLSSKF